MIGGYLIKNDTYSIQKGFFLLFLALISLFVQANFELRTFQM